MSIPDFGVGERDALPSPGENVPDPAHLGRRRDGDPDVTWPGRESVVAVGREDRRRHVVDADTGTARCGAPVGEPAPGQRADCPDCAVYT